MLRIGISNTLFSPSDVLPPAFSIKYPIGATYTTHSVEVNKNVCIVGDLSMIGNMTAITRPYNDNTTYVATTEYVMNQGYTTPQTLFKQFT